MKLVLTCVQDKYSGTFFFENSKMGNWIDIQPRREGHKYEIEKFAMIINLH